MITMRIIAVKLPMMIPMTRDMVADMPESFTYLVYFMWQWQWAVSWRLGGWKRWRRLEKSTFLRIHLLPLLFLLHLLFVLSLLLFVHVVLLVVALNHFVLGLESNTLSANTESQQNDNLDSGWQVATGNMIMRLIWDLSSNRVDWLPVGRLLGRGSQL